MNELTGEQVLAALRRCRIRAAGATSSAWE